MSNMCGKKYVHSLDRKFYKAKKVYTAQPENGNPSSFSNLRYEQTLRFPVWNIFNQYLFESTKYFA